MYGGKKLPKYYVYLPIFQSAEAETTYKACVAEANNRQHVLLKVKSELLAAVREQILFSDQCIKKVSEMADIITYL